MHDTAMCPIWRLWMSDYKVAMARARKEQARNDEVFAAAKAARDARQQGGRPQGSRRLARSG